MADITYHYFTAEHAIKEHQYIIEQSGGLPGVKNVGMLESVLHHIQDDRFYPELIDKITHLVFGINKNHAFNDGNKRASIALSSFFLELNGHDFAVRQYQHGMEEPAVWLASSLIDQEALKEIITFLLYEDEWHVASFVEQAKLYRQPIEQSLISKQLLTQMVAEWLGEDMQLSESTKLAVLEAIAPEEFGSNAEDNA